MYRDIFRSFTRLIFGIFPHFFNRNIHLFWFFFLIRIGNCIAFLNRSFHLGDIAFYRYFFNRIVQIRWNVFKASFPAIVIIQDQFLDYFPVCYQVNRDIFWSFASYIVMIIPNFLNGQMSHFLSFFIRNLEGPILDGCLMKLAITDM